MRRRSLALIGHTAAVMALLTACAKTIATSPVRPTTTGSEETGLASWYGVPYHGRPTASGEIYDMRDMTAAHRTLPFGTRISVVNLANSREAEVRINDRGPFVAGRFLDLSYGAASALNAVEAGVVPVKIRVVAPPGEPPSTAPFVGAPGTFSVQVAAFARRSSAEKLRDAVASDGSAAYVVEALVAGDVVYRVRVGPFADKSSAQAAADRLSGRGYLAVVIVPER